MQTSMTIVLMVQIVAALAMSGLILVQHGKGADMGAAFGSGSSGSLFGASGSANFLSRMTAVAATVFFASTLLMAFMASSGLQQKPADLEGTSVFDSAVPLTAPTPQTPSTIPGADGTSSSVLSTEATQNPQSETPANAPAEVKTTEQAEATNAPPSEASAGDKAQTEAK